MFALLPDLLPRDSHSLWYTSSRNPFSSSNTHDAHLNNPNNPNNQHHEHSHGHPHGANTTHRRGAHLIERSPLARLRADEQNLERRQQNVTNFGSAWLKPPGLPKTLHQLREERREAEEHQESLRREQLAQELAEAEAEAAGGAAAAGAGDATGGGDPDVMLDAPPNGDDGMDDVQLDGTHDLDDDIPEADDADFGLSDNEDEDDDEEEDDDDEDEEDEDTDEREMRAARAQQQQLMAQRMRQANDAFREDMARGRDSAAFYGVDEEIDDEDQSQMIEEDDLVGAHGDMDDMGMGADLDDEIPEAESMGGYEHTDTEAELSSSIGEDDNNNSRMSFVAPQQANRLRHSLARSDATRNSIAISDILSRDGSSVLGSSPVVPRQRIALSSRRGRG